MKWAIAFVGAGVCAFAGIRIAHSGEVFLGINTILLGAVFVLTADRLQREQTAARDPLADWRQSPAFNRCSNLED